MLYIKAEKKINEVKEKHTPQIGIVVYADGNSLMTQVCTAVVTITVMVFCDSITLFARRLYFVVLFQ